MKPLPNIAAVPSRSRFGWLAGLARLASWVIGASWLALANDTSAPAGAPNPSPAKEIFRVGMSSACFRNVNRIDATAAYRVFLETNGRRYGHDYRAEVEVFDDAPAFQADLRQTPRHLIVVEAWQYLSLDLGDEYRPYFVVAERGRVGRKYLLLTHRDASLHTLASLRGQSILQLRHAAENAGGVWLDCLLEGDGLGTQPEFFSAVEMVEKPMAAVLPVFFRKHPACLVDEPGFETMTALNPQVGQALRVLAGSEALADVVLCLNERIWVGERDKADTIQSLQELHLQPTGQQILTLFKIDRLVAFEETYLDSLRRLRVRHEARQRPPAK